MAKIAALLLPARRAEELEDATVRLSAALALSPGASVEAETYYGQAAVCSLVRVGPDLINRASQPLATGRRHGLMCGYYFSGIAARPDRASEPAMGDTAGRLLGDLAELGEDCLADGDGVFAFAQWDPAHETLTAGVDKLGIRPLFWTGLSGGGYGVATEVKALVPLLDSPEVNWAAWEEQLHFGDILGDHTLINGIRRVKPAEVLTFRAGGVRSRQVEQFLSEIEIRPRPVADFLEENASAFKRSLDRCLDLLDEKATQAVTLSAGKDSRRIAASLLLRGKDFEAFTVPLPLPDGREFESQVAERLCQKFGIVGYRVFPESSGDARLVTRVRDLSLDFESHQHLYAAVLALGVPCHRFVNLDGLGGDIFIYGAYVKPPFFDRVASFERKHFGYRPRWLHLPKADPPLHERVRAALEPYRNHPHWVTLFYFTSHSRRGISLAPATVQANSFESLYPYLDRAVVKSGLSLPPDVLGANDLQQRALERLEPELVEIPTLHPPHDVLGDGWAGDNSRYLDWGLRRRLALLSDASRSLETRLPGFLPVRQRWELALSSALGHLMPGKLLRWQFQKAEFATRVANHVEITGSARRYQEEVEGLRGMFGAKETWIERM